MSVCTAFVVNLFTIPFYNPNFVNNSNKLTIRNWWL